MTAPVAELEALRRNTTAFIAAKYTDLQLTPYTRGVSGTGVEWLPGTPKPLQRVRIIDQSGIRGPEPGTVLGADGRQRLVEYQLLGEWDADFGLYDRWTDAAGIAWEVADLLPYNGYERRAQVVRYAE